MIPYDIKFTVIAKIHRDGFKELLDEGYSESQIIGFIKQNIQKCFNLDKVTMPVTSLDVQAIDDDYVLVKRVNSESQALGKK